MIEPAARMILLARKAIEVGLSQFAGLGEGVAKGIVNVFGHDYLLGVDKSGDIPIPICLKVSRLSGSRVSTCQKSANSAGAARGTAYVAPASACNRRSEEHTSELQS